MTLPWRNWSGNVRCSPSFFERPDDEAELRGVLNRATSGGVEVRAVGSGHSFSPLCASDGMLISTEGLRGVSSADPARHEVTVRAGTRISDLGEILLAAGMAMENQGDIDKQTLAGAISTGTHGTGLRFGSLSTSVSALRLVLASGEVLECSEAVDPEVFRAARLSLGLLGVISEVTLRLVSAYRLRERTWAASVEACVADLDAHQSRYRHFEFYWLPGPDRCVLKTLERTDEGPRGEAPTELAPPGTVERYLTPERVDWSYRVFPSERTVRFNEMEYAVALADGPECFLEIRRLVLERHPEVGWAVEYRTQKADDVYLSPAYGRDVATISVHQAAELPYGPFFADAEAIFRSYGGRPHWGKIHSLGAVELAALCPKWGDFGAVRDRLDPSGRFMSEALRRQFVGSEQGAKL